MCGRFAFFGNNQETIASLGSAEEPFPFESYNIAPSQDVLALRTWPETDRPEWTTFRWGLVPFWSKTSKTKFPMINARAEGIEKKPSFRGPFKYRRCIIPASGFYEWQKRPGGKQPYFIRPTGGVHFAMAGIWDHWQGMGLQEIESCAIITTTPNSMMANIHDRMPVILAESDLAAWLDPKAGQGDLLALLQPYPAEKMDAYPVSNFVNSPRNNGAGCVELTEIIS